MELYSRVIRHLDTTFIGVSDCEEMRKILRIVLSPEQAEALLQLGHPPVLHGARHVARRIGSDISSTGVMLDEMAGRGVIGRMVVLGRTLYFLLPIIPGFYELTFMKTDSYPEHKEELRDLWARYKQRALYDELGDFPTPSLRVVPVGIALQTTHQIFHRDEMTRIIERAGLISIGTCACRETIQGCDRPRDVCMIFDQMGELLSRDGFTRKVDVAEAKRCLAQAEESGLVHAAMNCQLGVQIVCNCCGCCCSILSGLVKHKKPHSVAVSSTVAHIDPKCCKNCGMCQEVCWVDAISSDGERTVVDAEACIGCGLCLMTCRLQAMQLKQRKGHPSTPLIPLSLWGRMAHERGKLGAMARALVTEVR